MSTDDLQTVAQREGLLAEAEGAWNDIYGAVCHVGVSNTGGREREAVAIARGAFHGFKDGALARIEALERERDEAYALLTRIGDYAHDRSKGPAEWDPLWEIRSMAYSGAKT